jgi:hypothetical protein
MSELAGAGAPRGEKTRRHPIPSIRSDPLVGDSRKECRPAAAGRQAHHACSPSLPPTTIPVTLTHRPVSVPPAARYRQPTRGIPCHGMQLQITSHRAPRRPRARTLLAFADTYSIFFFLCFSLIKAQCCAICFFCNSTQKLYNTGYEPIFVDVF